MSNHRSLTSNRARAALAALLVTVLAVLGLAPTTASAAGAPVALRVTFRSPGGALLGGACYEIWRMQNDQPVDVVATRCNGSGIDITSIVPGVYRAIETQPPHVKFREDGTDEPHVYQRATYDRFAVVEGNDTEITIFHEPGAEVVAHAELPDGTAVSGACFEASFVSAGDATDEACTGDSTTAVLYVQPGAVRVRQTTGPAGQRLAPERLLSAPDVDGHYAVTLTVPAGGELRVEQQDADGRTIVGGCYALYLTGTEGRFIDNICDHDDDVDDGALAFVGLEPGGYRLVEESAPAGYHRAEDLEMSLGDGQLRIVARRHVPLPQLFVRTVTTANTAVGGSCWEVQLAAVPEATVEHRCDVDDGADDGTTTFTTLTPDEYLLAHVSAPDGFEAIYDPVPVTMTDDPQTVTLTLGGSVPPANTVAPTVTGEPRVGSTLHADEGEWVGSEPMTRFGRWQRCDVFGQACADIRNAIEPEYTVVEADAGSTLRFLVTAGNAAGSLDVASAPTAEVQSGVPVRVGLPEITGVAKVGNVLLGTTGAWTGNPSAFARQWLRCDVDGAACQPIAGATSMGYMVSAADVGSTIRLDVTASNAAGSTTARSTITNVVPAVPTATTPPTIVGSMPGLPGVLAGGNGQWSYGLGPVSFTYRWLRCTRQGDGCIPIEGATTRLLLATGDDAGHAIRFEVSATTVAGTGTAVSAPWLVPATPVNTSPPSVTGRLQIGDVLTIDRGTWSSEAPITRWVYDWQRCDADGEHCADLAVTQSSYRLLASDVGSTFRATVRAFNGQVWSGDARSAATAVLVRHVPINTVAPTVSGRAKVGQTLKAARGAWVSDTTITGWYYRWVRCDADGTDCIFNADDDATSYKVRASDAGKIIRVQVKASNRDGWSEMAPSAYTAVVVR